MDDPICEICKETIKAINGIYEPFVVLMRPSPTRFWHADCAPIDICDAATVVLGESDET